MKSMNRSPYHLFLLLLISLSLAGCAAQAGPDASLVQDAGFMLDGFAVKRVTEENSCYSLQMDYPVLGQKGIDKQIREWVNAKYDEVTEELAGVCKHTYPAQKFRFWSEYDLYTTSRTVSLVFKSYIYAGGDQYFDTVETVNYLWNSGNAIGYKDIFAQPQGLFNSLSAQVSTKLGPGLRPVWENHPEYKNGLEPAESSFQHFAITEQGLMLYFPTRQIAPFYAGPQQCDISLGGLGRFSPKPDIWQ